MTTTKKLTAVALSALLIFALSACDEAQQSDDGPEATAEAAEADEAAEGDEAVESDDGDEGGAVATSGETIALDVEGMDCVSCAGTIEDAFDEADGVITGSIDFGESRADVEYDPDQIDVDGVIAIIDDAGFTASLPGEESDETDEE